MRHNCIISLLLLLFAATPAFAETPVLTGSRAFGGSAAVDLVADELNYDREQQTLTAEGEVRIKKGDLTLLADKVLWRPESEEAEATGNVRLDAPEGVLEGEGIRLNMQTGLGHLSRAQIFLRDGNYRIAGEEIDRLAGDKYRILGGTLTTCEGVPPAWKFTARRMDVTVGGYARAKHVFFYLRDLPVLYLPFIAYPVKTERESGFLMPRIGSSSKRGFQLSLAWYQVIDRHLDATVYLDYLAKMGIGKGLEYRYVFGEEAEGTAHLYHITGTGDEKDRYALDWQHAGRIPGDVRLTADVEYVSSRDYFEDFGVVAEEYNQDQAQSVLAATRQWRRSILAGQFKYTKDLEQDNDQTLQKLPEVVFSTLPYRLAETPFYFAFDSAFTHFWRREGMTGDRFTLRPELSAVFHPGHFLEIRPAVGYRERFYSTSEEGPGYAREGVVDFSTRVSTRFSRIYTPERGKASKLRHSIEPEFVYHYIPHEDQSDLPQFDTLDSIEAQNKVGYGLISRLVARLEGAGGEPLYHEYAYLRLSQVYDFRGQDADAPPGAVHPFSPLRTELIVRPNPFSYIDLDLRYDTNSDAAERWTSISARAGMHDGVGNGLSAEYQYEPDKLSYFGAAVDLARLRPVYINYQHRHDFDAGEILEQVLNLEYRSQCWSVFLTFRDRLEETEYLVSFALTGLGKVTELGGRLRGGRE